jgi:hypothetical protein
VTLTGVLPVLMREAAHTARGMLEGLIGGAPNGEVILKSEKLLVYETGRPVILPTPKTGRVDLWQTRQRKKNYY